MKISIIIPVYNTMKYLEKCINSVLRQNFKGIEVICVNDCSNDDSLRVLERYKEIDDRIIVINNEKNVGLSESRNRGIRIASGEFVMFLDSDDYIADNSLTELYYKVKNKDLDVLFFGYQEHLLENNIVIHRHRIEYYPQIFLGMDFFCDSQKKNIQYVTTWSAIYKLRFLKENNLQFIKGLLHEDNLFYFEVLMKAKKVSSINKCYYEYIRRENSITLSSDNIQEKIWSISKIIYKINNYKAGMLDYYKYCINDYLYVFIKEISNNYRKIKYFDMDKYPLCPEIDIIMKFVGITFYNGFFTYKLPQEVVEDIKKYKKIIIYGAGKVGQGLCELLREYNIYTDLFVQTNCIISKEKAKTQGIDTKAIDDVKNKDNAVVLVANKKDSQEMYNNAVKLGFENIINVSKYI